MLALLILLFVSSPKEYSNICDGLQKEFAINSNEFIGYITEDNQLIVTSYGSFSKVESNPIHTFNGKNYIRVKNKKKLYQNEIVNRLGIFIPIKGTIHSHNPQCELKESGLDQMSNYDIEYAKRFTAVKHYIYGCNGMAEYNGNGLIKVEVSQFNICDRWLM